MTKKQTIEFVAKILGWKTDWDDGTVEFSQHSPAGNECVVSLNYKNVTDIPALVAEYYEGYDPSYEAYLWLDEFGHGKNGAPDNMGDVYADMQECERMIKTLSEALNRI